MCATPSQLGRSVELELSRVKTGKAMVQASDFTPHTSRAAKGRSCETKLIPARTRRGETPHSICGETKPICAAAGRGYPVVQLCRRMPAAARAGQIRSDGCRGPRPAIELFLMLAATPGGVPHALTRIGPCVTEACWPYLHGRSRPGCSWAGRPWYSWAGCPCYDALTGTLQTMGGLL